MTVSPSGQASDIRATSVTFDLDGCRATLHVGGAECALTTPLIGAHNLENALVALGMATAFGVPLHAALAGLAQATGAPGRLERIGARLDAPRVFVDYAHTPDALDNVLGALRPLTPAGQRLAVVFGAGGDRDAGKRPLMAQAAARHADLIVVTSDNPRTEPPEAIVAAVVAGLPADATHHVAVDRAAAIGWAIAQAEAGDVVLIAGKGHEDYQVIGTERIPFDDAAVARAALGDRP